jgi:hypothetical protein
MTPVSQRLFPPVAAALIVSAVFREAVTIPVSFQLAHRAAPVLA